MLHKGSLYSKIKKIWTLDCFLFSLLFCNKYNVFENYDFLQRAIKEGADFIETDILASKDGVLICFHDFTLDNTTDIAEHKEFADRKTTYEVQGTNTTGWFPGSKLGLS